MPSRDDALSDFLAGVGIAPRVTEAALEIDAVMQRWRRRFFKRELGHRALNALGLADQLDLTQLDVLIAIWAPTNEFGEESQQETMIGTVADRLRIDPSRASRLVSEAISRGYARRTVSQEDARRTVVELTDRGTAVVHAVRHFKFLVMGEFLSDWTEEEIATFLPLLERFSSWTDEAGRFGPGRLPDEIARIAATLKNLPES